MAFEPARVRHRKVAAGGLNLFFREAGDPNAPAVLLLHGFPSSSHTFRNVMEPLAEAAYVVAPDMPGFGFSDAPPVDAYDYTFENLANAIEALTDELGLGRLFLYVHDFGGPAAYQLAMRRPERVLGLIVQNGAAHEEGLGHTWDTARAFWADPSPENRAKLPDWLNFEGTRDQYLHGPERLRPLVPPESWHLDWERLSRPGNIEAQFRLFMDYQSHVARFGEISAYHRARQPPCLVLWGRHDVYFELPEIMAYARELDRLEIHVFDGGHLLLETHHRECAAEMVRFIRRAQEADAPL